MSRYEHDYENVKAEVVVGYDEQTQFGSETRVMANQLSVIDNELDKMDTVLGLVFERLSPALRREDPKPSPETAMDLPEASAHVEQLRRQTLRIRTQCGALHELLQRLDI